MATTKNKPTRVKLPAGEGRHGVLNAYSLAGLGIGGVIGGGYYLGSGLAVHVAGPAVVIAFLLGGLIMMQVLGAMSSINVNRMAHGSFRLYIEQMLGTYAGFLIGWTVFISGILGLGSEALAMGTFARYWFPTMPLPVLATLFTVLVVLLNTLGIENFGKIEAGMGAVKSLSLVAFILLGAYALLTFGSNVSPFPLSGVGAFFPNGFSGVLQAMLIVIFAYSGIGAVAMASAEVRNPHRDIPRASGLMSVGIISLYTLSMLVLVMVTPWSQVYTDKSPFVQGFDNMGMHWASLGMNFIILMAAFSVMAATYYAAMQMLLSLAESKKAPAFVYKRTEKGFFRNAWLLVGAASLLVVALSFVMPPNLFNYLVSASSYFTFLNWSLNLVTFLIWLKKRRESETFVSPLIWGRAGAVGTLVVIAVLFVMSLRVSDFRMGFYAALAAVVVTSVGYWEWKRRQKGDVEQSCKGEER